MRTFFVHPARPSCRAFNCEEANMAPNDEDDIPLVDLEGVGDPDDPSIETLPDGTVIVSDDT